MIPIETEISYIRLNELHPAIRAKGILAYDKSVKTTPVGVHPVITETLRSFEKQLAYWKQGRDNKHEVITYSKPGQSYHQYGLALDFVLVVDGHLHWAVDHNWITVINCFKEQGFSSGIYFKPEKKRDPPHIQNRMGYTWRELLVKYNNNEFIEGTKYLKL